VTSIIVHAVPYTLGLLIPSIIASWYVGNKIGALAARRKVLDNTALPFAYALTATPYMWLAIMLSWTLAVLWQVFPVGFAYSPTANAAGRSTSCSTSRTTGCCRSSPSSSSRSAGGQSGCGT
jgi:peptide/nickel transport system permease protein